MRKLPARRSWIAGLRTWWLTAATTAASIALLTWAASIASFDPADLPPPSRAALTAAPQGRDDGAGRVRAPIDDRTRNTLVRPQPGQPQPSARHDEELFVASTAADIRGPEPLRPDDKSERPPFIESVTPPLTSTPAPLMTAGDEEVEPAVLPQDTRQPDRSRAVGGWVFDEDGAAVEGIAVLAEGRRMFDGTSPPARLRAVSDGTGAFAFAKLPDGEYQLRTEPTTAYDSAAALVRAGADAVVLEVAAKSKTSLVVHGAVESSRGKVLTGVRVEMVGHPAMAAFSDAKGQYVLRVAGPGRLQSPSVRFALRGYRDATFPLARDAGDIVQNVRLEELTDASTLTGSVRGNDGAPVAGATIELYSAERGRSYRGSSDRNGAFAITGIDTATDYRLWVRPASQYKDRTLDEVIIGGAIDVIVDALAATTFNGRFVTPDGQPVPGFTMWLTPAYGARRALSVTSNGQGAFAVADVPEGPLALGTRAAPVMSVTGIRASSNAVDVRIPIDVGPHRLEGSVMTPDGQPIGGARISLNWSAGMGVVSSSSRDTVTDSNGTFLFTQLGSGTHTLAVTATGFRALQSAAAVGPGNPPIALTLQRGH